MIRLSQLHVCCLFHWWYISLTDHFKHLLETQLDLGGALMIPTWMTGGCWRRVGCPTNRTLSIFSSNFLPHMSDLVAKMVARMMSENLFRRGRNEHSDKCHTGKKRAEKCRAGWGERCFSLAHLGNGVVLIRCSFLQQRSTMTIREKLLWLLERRGEEKASRRNSDVTGWRKSVTCWFSGKSCCN